MTARLARFRSRASSLRLRSSGFLRRHFFTLGLVIGTVFFSISLTPSLLPRTSVVQGILSGCAFAAGYGLGAAIQWSCEALGAKMPQGRFATILTSLAALACAVLVVVTLNYTLVWQNSVRSVMGMELADNAQPLLIALVAIGPALLLILLGKLVVMAIHLVWRWLEKLPYVPRRVALAASIVIVGILGGVLVDGVLLRAALRAADGFYERLDELVPQDAPAPARPEQTGSAASRIAWDTIGRDARVYVTGGPDAAAITRMTGKPAIDPLRIYVGLRSAPTVEARVQLALAEMDRVGAFQRSVLVLAMPVGTGWIDPAAMDTLEYLQGGDVASVAVQYSYLTSWLSLVVEPAHGINTAQALFEAVYERWTAMPPDARPRLYLHGLSQGALVSQASSQPFDILADPYQGALWAGPPFPSSVWRFATTGRHPDSPEWLPRFGNQRAIRFANQHGVLDGGGAQWGPLRIVFLQYASDPIVFFAPEALYREPDWMRAPRGFDVSPALTWYPVVTFLQLALDMALAQTSPIGYGHVYAPADYIDAWLAVADPPGWSSAQIAALKAAIDPHDYLPDWAK